MGCGQAKPLVTEKHEGVLVRSAKDLRDADWMANNASDPYVVCRLGRAGSSWKDKGRDTETRSETVWGEASPVWQHAFSFMVPEGVKRDAWELHLRVYDKDILTADDFIGEVQITIQRLGQQPNVAVEYPLSGKSGSVMVMMGDRVVEQLIQEMKQAVAIKQSASWWVPALTAVRKLGQYFYKFVADQYYYNLMVQLLIAWGSSVRGDRDPSSEWFLKRSVDPSTGKDTYRWDGPLLHNCVTLSSHSEVSKLLAQLGEKRGTNNVNGTAYKPNFLGFQRMNPRVWPEVPWHAIGLGAPQEAHAFIRPLLTKVSGPGGRWSMQWLEGEARHFFQGRNTISINEDLRVWVTRILHQVFVGLQLTEEEGAEFMDMQKQIIILAGAPEEAMDIPPIAKLLEFESTMKKKAKWIERYKPLLKKHLPEETRKMSDRDLLTLASGFMDALLFAGGQSVPTVLQFALAVPYSKWGEENLPKDFRFDDISSFPSYLWEVIRRFPPVSGVVYTDRSFGNSPEQTKVLNCQMAQRDPQVWPDAGSFLLRPVSEYLQKSVGFAEPAVAPHLASPNAHACPAKDLALAMCLAFLREFARSVAELVDTSASSYKSVWVAESADAEDGVHRKLAPEEIDLTGYGTTSFRLSKKSIAAMPPPSERSGAELLKNLSAEEQALVLKRVQRASKFDKTDKHTQTLIFVVQTFVQPERPGPASKVGPPLPQTKFEDYEVWTGPFPGLRMIKTDEDQLSGRIVAAVKYLTFAFLDGEAALPNDEAPENLVFFDSPVEAVVEMDVAFGRVLPAQYTTWTNMGTDAGLVDMCVAGVGAWYLQGARSAKDSGHDVPTGAAFECNLEYMAKYETRRPWNKYGGTAYLGPAQGEGSALPRDVLGIWSSHHRKLIRPGDALWEQAKAGFRSSLVTSITLREHLAICHWTMANGLQVAVRESTGADHPLRRLLKQFYFGTAAINERSTEILLPPDRLGFRTFGFSEKGWVEYFQDIFTEWSWTPFPEQLKRRDLPASFMESWPLKQDGEMLWNAFQKYVRDYLQVFYPSSDALMKDAEVIAFWKHFDQYLPWKLPQLSFDSLVALLADLMWWVTAGHEYVGSIVEYLTTLSGLAPKIADGKEVADVRTFAQALSLISLTGMRMPPLMDDWTHIFQVDSWKPEQRQAVLNVVRLFQAQLEEVADEVDNLNYLRERRGERKFVAFNPRILESSVAI